MKLKTIVKEILSEITLMSGDASTDTSWSALRQLSREWPGFNKTMEIAYSRDWTNMGTGWDDDVDRSYDPTHAKVRAFIKDAAVDSQGSLYICRYKYDDRINHVLFNLAAPNLRTMYVGKIETNASTGEYSMKTLFGIDSQVVHWSMVTDEYKGKKYGAFLYDTLLYMYGVLESDTILYSGSLKMWMHHLFNKGRLGAATINYSVSSGTQSGDKVLVLPISAREVQDKSILKAIGSIVVFHSNIPPQLSKLIKLTKGLSVFNDSLSIMYANINMDELGFVVSIERTRTNAPLYSDQADANPEENYSLLDYLEVCSFSELLSVHNGIRLSKDSTVTEELIAPDVEYWDENEPKQNKTKKLIVYANNGILVVEPNGDNVKYTLI